MKEMWTAPLGARLCTTRATQRFHKAVLTRFGNWVKGTEGVAIPSTRKVAQKSFGYRLLPPEVDLEGTGKVIFGKGDGSVY
jgi:hypothetical protein